MQSKKIYDIGCPPCNPSVITVGLVGEGHIDFSCGGDGSWETQDKKWDDLCKAMDVNGLPEGAPVIILIQH